MASQKNAPSFFRLPMRPGHQKKTFRLENGMSGRSNLFFSEFNTIPFFRCQYNISRLFSQAIITTKKTHFFISVFSVGGSFSIFHPVSSKNPNHSSMKFPRHRVIGAVALRNVWTGFPLGVLSFFHFFAFPKSLNP